MSPAAKPRRPGPRPPAAAPSAHQAFATPGHLDRWLRANHATARELWVRIFKKAAATPTVSWDDCVVAALTWGWIDGQKQSLDDASFLQRVTPRRPRSTWSRRNRAHAERLIAAGQMQPPGLAQVEAARQDGRWANAYAGSAEMIIPADFLAELERHPTARARYATLDRRNLFTIYHRLHTAARPETRARRLAKLIAQLDRGERFH